MLLVRVREELKFAEYEPPAYGEKPVAPAEPKMRFCVTEPFAPAPPMVEAVGIVALS